MAIPMTATGIIQPKATVAVTSAVKANIFKFYQKCAVLSMLFLFFPGVAFSAQTITQPLSFRGIDHANTPTDVDDTRAVDAQNMVGDILGAASKRNGSERYIDQAISTNPISSLYRASLDQGTTTKRVLLMTTADRIYVSTGDLTPVWRELKSGLVTPNQRFSFANHKGQIVMTGEALTDPVYKYDIATDSFSELISADTSTEAVKIRAKFATARDGYLLLSNCLDIKDLNGNTTYYGSRVYYSLFNQISSFTYTRFINIATDDGESISGVTDKGTDGGSLIVFYKPSSVTNLTYTTLNLTLLGGDIAVDTVVKGFGCISPYALVNTGEYDFVPTKDGIILYNGGRKTRLNIVDEVRPISTLIKPNYERTITQGTFDKAAAIYYPKKQWVVYSFSDPYFSPSNRANRVFIFDLQTGEWWPQKNWLAGSFTTFDNDGTLLYGDSNDGYVYKADLDIRNDDARKEISLDSMDSSTTWTNSTRDTINVIEGSASLKMTSNFSNSYFSSMTKINLFNFGEWYDRSLVSRDKDYLSFKLRMSSLTDVSTLRVDLQFGQTVSSFTTYFSSVSLSSGALVSMGLTNGAFKEIKILLSSFSIPDSWTNPITQEVPFANNLTAYGVRFVTTGISTCTINVDDLRVVGGENSVVEAYYLTKQFNLGSVADKDWRQIILTREKSADSSFKIDVYTDFGQYANTKNIDREIPKEIFVCGYKGTTGITRLKSTDFSVIDSTRVSSSNERDYMNGLANREYLLAFDKVTNRLLMLDRSTPSVIVSSFGGLGSGTTNFNTVNQMCQVGDNLFLTDNFNDRIVHLAIKNKRLVLVRVYGELGSGATNFFAPSGITADQTSLWILDDGNSRISKYTHDFKLISSTRFDSNTIGTGVLQNDGENIYAAYNKTVEKPYYQDVVLEKRTKGNDIALIQRVSLRPEGVVEQSTYTLSGDFALLGKYLFIGFTKDIATTGTYYVQKLIKNGFNLVDEYSTSGTEFSVIGDALPYKPILQSEKINLESRNGTYIQLKFYDNELDNAFKLYNYAFALDPKPYEEQKR